MGMSGETIFLFMCRRPRKEDVKMKGLSVLEAASISPLAVMGLGLAIVFIGLICIIILVTIIGKIMQAGSGNKATVLLPAETAPVVQSEDIPNRGEFVAAVTAAIAEELGEDISKIRIHSIRRI